MPTLSSAEPYHFTPEIADHTGQPAMSRVRYPDAGRGDAEALVMEKLGVKGWGRLEHFRLFYGGGWGKGPQKPMSPKSYDILIRSLPLIHPPASAKPSIFLTDTGNLELAWKDDQGRAFQIEFGPAEAEIYDEASGIDTTVPNTELAAFLAKLP